MSRMKPLLRDKENRSGMRGRVSPVAVDLEHVPRSLACGRTEILCLLCAAQLMLVLDFSIVNVALPSIGLDLGLDRHGLQWIVTAYALTFGGFLMVGGRAADLFGRRRMFVLGLLVFSLASLMGGFAHHAWVLIAARALQGIGAAAVGPAILSLITTTFPEGRERHYAMGWLGTMSTVGFATGMILGGVLTSSLGWQWVMFVNVPAGVLVMVLASRVLPGKADLVIERHVDVASAVLVTGAAASLVYALAEASVAGWRDLHTVLPLLAALVQAALFVVLELRSSSPLIPKHFFGNRNLLGANGTAMLLAAASPATVFLLSFYMQGSLGYSPLATGLAFLPQATMAFMATRLVPRLVGRYGPRRIMLVGILLLCGGLVTYTQIRPSTGYIAGILPGMLIAPVGTLMGFICSMIIATTGVPHEDQGLAAGMLSTAQQLGAAIGLATVVYVMGSGGEAAEACAAAATSLPAGFIAATAFGVAALVVALLFTRSPSAAAIDPAEPAAALH